jgi:hypothetical protein
MNSLPTFRLRRVTVECLHAEAIGRIEMSNINSFAPEIAKATRANCDTP